MAVTTPHVELPTYVHYPKTTLSAIVDGQALVYPFSPSVIAA